MKTLEFKTSKGIFVLSDENYYLVNERGVKTAYLNNEKQFEYTSFIRLSEITEEQASGIIGEMDNRFNNHDYLLNLILSKGIHLYENPFIKPNIPNEQTLKKMHNKGYGENDFVDLKYDQHIYELAEQQTFYNPVIFKL